MERVIIAKVIIRVQFATNPLAPFQTYAVLVACQTQDVTLVLVVLPASSLPVTTLETLANLRRRVQVTRGA